MFHTYIGICRIIIYHLYPISTIAACQFGYTAYAGWAVTAGIPVKFSTAHGRLRPEVGSTKCIDAYGSRQVLRPSLLISNSLQQITADTVILRPKHNFYSLTVCS